MAPTDEASNEVALAAARLRELEKQKEMASITQSILLPGTSLTISFPKIQGFLELIMVGLKTRQAPFS